MDEVVPVYLFQIATLLNAHFCGLFSSSWSYGRQSRRIKHLQYTFMHRLTLFRAFPFLVPTSAFSASKNCFDLNRPQLNVASHQCLVSLMFFAPPGCRLHSHSHQGQELGVCCCWPISNQGCAKSHCCAIQKMLLVCTCFFVFFIMQNIYFSFTGITHPLLLPKSGILTW